ncbi:DUF4442 domain-containing protein [Sandaracinus amylolyticus]|uniref:DUF4442 domain-containing protein n=1 Tax=Sandaracinus amylolyticus TaxID=927083 RepID=UPI001F3763A0|nr:DUF4442 domain-containing protein [Sandaracinus amylolyticus]UJR83502.1 Hypothetical protein I5071_55700 [Sandaracinus amylolyticus]
MSVQAVQQAIAGVPFNAFLGLEVIEAEPGRAAVKLPDVPSLKNHVGGPHAAAMYAAAEAASGAVVFSVFADRLGEVLPLLAGASVDYRKLAMGAAVARAELATTREAVLDALATSPKGAEVPVRVVIEDGAGRAVAEMSARWFLRKNG